jgi:hypothetical protein
MLSAEGSNSRASLTSVRPAQPVSTSAGETRLDKGDDFLAFFTPFRQTYHYALNRVNSNETFRDLKRLLGMTRLMNKQQQIVEKMLALLLLMFAIGLLLGEGLRDYLYGERQLRRCRIRHVSRLCPPEEGQEV